jgi:adenylate kinase
LLFEADLRLTAVIYLDVPEDVIFKRLTGRRLCRTCTKGNFNVYTMPPKEEGKCDHDGGELYQRPDDTEDVIRQRLDTYKAQTEPLIAFYKARGQLRAIPYEGTIDDMVSKVFDAIDKEEIGRA